MPASPESQEVPPEQTAHARSLIVESDRAVFANIAPRWDAVAASLEHPFLKTQWLSAWWETFRPQGSSLALIQAYEQDRLTCGLPLYRQGPRVHGLANVHTPISGAVRGTGDALAALPPPDARSRRIVWPGLDHAAAGELAARLRESGWATIVEPQHRSPLVAMRESADAYAHTLGRSTRQRAGRLERKLVRDESARFRLLEPNQDERLFEKCLQLEASGWKGRRGTAVLSDPRTTQFYRTIGRMPEARLSIVDRGGTPISFALCLLHRAGLYLLKTAYDERYRTLAPGFVLQYALIARCHELQLERYELLGGADAWKLRFANGSRAISRLVAYPDDLLGRSRLGLRHLRPAAKKLRRLRPRPH